MMANQWRICEKSSTAPPGSDVDQIDHKTNEADTKASKQRHYQATTSVTTAAANKQSKKQNGDTLLYKNR